MTPALTLVEFLAWNQESAEFWKSHFEANPTLLQLPCDISGVANVQEFVRHIWSVELIWGQRIAGLPLADRKELPVGPLEALFDLHLKAIGIYRDLLGDPTCNWEDSQTLKSPWLPPEGLIVSKRKMLAHALFHGQRHWAQLSTLLRTLGFPSGFKGDLLLSSALT